MTTLLRNLRGRMRSNDGWSGMANLSMVRETRLFPRLLFLLLPQFLSSLTMDEKPHIRIELRSDPCYLAGVRQLIAGVAQRIGFDDNSCSQVALAVDEALANVIRHGYCQACDRPIWISLWPSAETEDRGAGLRIEIAAAARHVPEPALGGRDLDAPKPGGRGLHIIREVMDEVAYHKRSPRGMRLTMEKFAQKPAADAVSAAEGE